MRVAVLIIVLTVMGTEASYAIRNNVRLDMEGSGITLILGSLGLKAAQRAAEKEQPTTP